MEEKAEYLNQIDLFETLSDSQRDTLTQQTRLLHYPAGSILFMPEDAAELLFILKEGRIQLYRMAPDGRKLTLALLSPSAIFGYMSFVGHHLRQTYAEALEDSAVCTWKRHEVEEMLASNPGFALRVLTSLGDRLAQVEARFADLAFERAPVRLASLLLQVAVQRNGMACVLGLSHQSLAEMLGVYRETVSQMLRDFRARGWVATQRKTIVLLNVEALREFSGAQA